MAAKSAIIASAASNKSCRTIYRNLVLLIQMYDNNPDKLDKLVHAMVES